MAITKAYLESDLNFTSLDFEDGDNVTRKEVKKIINIFIANNVADLIMHEEMIDKNTKNDVNKCVSVAMINRLSNLKTKEEKNYI